jgi:hypothetical protein
MNRIVFALPRSVRVISGAADDTQAEILKEYVNNANTNDWLTFGGTDQVLVRNLDTRVADEAMPSSPMSGHWAEVRLSRRTA